jgi:methionyl aminopeptidase
MAKEKIEIKTEEEIEILRQSSLLVGKTLAEIAKIIKPGISTLRLDLVAEEFIRDNGAVPGFKGYGDFPASLCISIND